MASNKNSCYDEKTNTAKLISVGTTCCQFLNGPHSAQYKVILAQKVVRKRRSEDIKFELSNAWSGYAMFDAVPERAICKQMSEEKISADYRINMSSGSQIVIKDDISIEKIFFLLQLDSFKQEYL